MKMINNSSYSIPMVTGFFSGKKELTSCDFTVGTEIIIINNSIKYLSYLLKLCK